MKRQSFQILVIAGMLLILVTVCSKKSTNELVIEPKADFRYERHL